jgi:hypothetical protein
MKILQILKALSKQPGAISYHMQYADEYKRANEASRKFHAVHFAEKSDSKLKRGNN